VIDTGLAANGGGLSTEGIYLLLREQILDGEFAPDAPISQAGLAEQYGVTRTPLREALRLLQREGLVQAEFNRRTRVSGLSMGELEQIYSQRILHETLAIRLGVPLFSDGDLDEMRALHARMIGLASADTFADWEQVHRRFHGLLVKYAGESLVRFILELADHSRRYRHQLLDLNAGDPSAFRPNITEHLSIVEACERRDISASGSLLARHLGRTALELVSLTDPRHEPRVIREALRLAIPSETPPG
jgi:DNA-binding GntR family transcriptional regulator